MERNDLDRLLLLTAKPHGASLVITSSRFIFIIKYVYLRLGAENKSEAKIDQNTNSVP